jgi:cytochrome c556
LRGDSVSGATLVVEPPMNKLLSPVLIALGLSLSAPAQAQFAKPEDAVKYRQSAFSLLGNHMSRINEQLKSGSPDLNAIRSSATLVQTLAALPFEAFTPGSDKVTTSKARPEIWKDRAKVEELTRTMQAEVAKLAAVAHSGDARAIQAQVGAVGQACKACHDDYRAK